MIDDVTKLKVYNESLILLQNVYALTKKLPRSEYDIVDQIRRCTKSIPANIAEGFAKHKSPKEFKRFLQIALGSSDEAISHLRTLYITCPYFQGEIKIIGNKFRILSKRINKLHSTWVFE